MGNKKIKQKEDIIIKDEYIPSEEEYKTIENKENWLKSVFVNILKDNEDDTVIKLVDIKNKFKEKLPDGIKDKKLEQILKNTIGSNKDNKTSLVREKCVDWYYQANEKKGFLILNEDERKPVQLPDKLKRSKKYKYYAFYNPVTNDSLDLFVNNLNAESVKEPTDSEKNRKNDSNHHDEKSDIDDKILDYDNIDFLKVKRNKTNYLEKQKRAMAIGDVGEKYILEKEIKKMEELGINEEPILVSKISDKFGFDILSYRINETEGIYRVFIEVKTTVEDKYDKFTISENEIEVSKYYQDRYILARVYNAYDENTITYEEYYGDVTQNVIFEKVKTIASYEYKIVKK